MKGWRAPLRRMGVVVLALLLLQPGGAAAQTEAGGLAAGDDPPPPVEVLEAPVDTAAEGLVDAPETPGDQRTLVVSLTPEALAAGQAQAMAAESGPSLAPGLAELGYVVVRVPAVSAAAYQAELAQRPGVRSVMEPQPVYTTDRIPNDPQWGMQYGPSRVQAPLAWSTTVGAPTVIIAIIDTGIDLGHADLSGKIWLNTAEIPGNGIDDEHNGFIDDVRGWDFHNWDNNPSDDHNPGHGTHVAGIAAAAGNNGLGIAGMAWNAKLMPLKVLGGDGSGGDWAVAEAIIYAAKRGAKVINMSLAGRGLGSYVRDAVNFANSQGVVVVAAAGNEGGSSLMEPAAFANVLGVVATDEGNNRAGYSNYGADADFAAPGSNIYSTLRGGYGYMTGTSMASPHVAGAAALLASLPQFNTPSRIRAALRLTVADGGSPGWDPYYGYGRIQVANALRIGFDAPPACDPPACYRVLMPFLQR